MADPEPTSPQLPAEVCHRAVDAQDPRFDGVFFVAITSTSIYCRPICPSRRADPERRRFYPSAAAAERAGFRPCLRCRPELAPGRALVDAVPRLAAQGVHRIAEGALNGRDVASLARELFVSERHLRRCLKREAGASPVELAQTQRLLLAKRLLAETTLSVSRVAYASGFQSLRRFNAVLRERYGMTPTDLRRASRTGRRRSGSTAARPACETSEPESAPLRLTLPYRSPFAWPDLLRRLGQVALPGVERVAGGRYARSARVEDRTGVLVVEHRPNEAGLVVEMSATFLPVLMPLLARLRRLFDLDAEPAVVEAHLAESGLGALVRRRPGLRLPGAFDGFEVALSALLESKGTAADGVVGRVVSCLGEPFEGAAAELGRLAPTAERVADAGSGGLEALGVPMARAATLARLARAVVEGRLTLLPGGDATETTRALAELEVDEGTAATIAMRALGWPDAFAASDPVLQRAAGVDGRAALLSRAERWRPWRAYAALHLRARAASLRSSPADGNP